MTREEFESILEEAFMAGYNDAIDEVFKEDNTFDLEDEMDSYDEAWKPSEFKSVKHAQDMIDAGHSGISKQTLGKNKADFFRKRIIPRIGKGLSQGKTFGDMIGEINKEKQMADTYYKPGHAVDQTNNYAHRVARYIAAKQNAKNNK